MRILFWTDGFWPEIGGLEVFCANLVRALQARDHVCEIITNREKCEPVDAISFEGATVHGFPFQDLLNRGRLKSVRDLHQICGDIVDRFQPDVIHLHGMSRSLFLFMRQQKRKSIPAIITLHDNLPEPTPDTLPPQALKMMSRIIAVSEHIHRQVLNFDPELKDRTQTILNALPEPEAMGVSLSSVPKVLVVGRLEKHKGFDLAIGAFTEIAEQFPEATLTLVGDGPEREVLEAVARDSSFGDRIQFMGWVPPDEMPRLFDQHSIVIVPSRWQEPFGLVALQAAQMVRPVIATRTGGLPEIVVNGVTGILCENESSSAIAEALRRLLSDLSLAAQLGRAARVHASTHFNFDHLVDRYEEVYARAAI